MVRAGHRAALKALTRAVLAVLLVNQAAFAQTAANDAIGVDIVDESLKIQMLSQMQPMQGQVQALQPLGGNAFIAPNALNVNSLATGMQANECTSGGMQNCLNQQWQATMMPYGQNANAMMMNQLPMYQLPATNGQLVPQAQAAQPQLDGKALQQTIGVLGAAAILGVFMQRGGIGGVLQDIGWDNRRHIRGPGGGY